MYEYLIQDIGGVGPWYTTRNPNDDMDVNRPPRLFEMHMSTEYLHRGNFHEVAFRKTGAIINQTTTHVSSPWSRKVVVIEGGHTTEIWKYLTTYYQDRVSHNLTAAQSTFIYL